MANLFFSMKLLKKFEFPAGFETKFVKDIMDKNGKESLSHFQNHTYKYNKRERANTYHDNYSNYYRSTYIILTL